MEISHCLIGLREKDLNSSKLNSLFVAGFTGNLYHLYFGLNDTKFLSDYSIAEFEAKCKTQIANAGIEVFKVSLDSEAKGWVFLLDNFDDTNQLLGLLREAYTAFFPDSTFFSLVAKRSIKVSELTDGKYQKFESPALDSMIFIRTRSVDFGSGNCIGYDSNCKQDFTLEYPGSQKFELGDVTYTLWRAEN